MTYEAWVRKYSLIFEAKRKEKEEEDDIPDLVDTRWCHLCLRELRNAVVVPCGHVYGCYDCLDKVKPSHCHICFKKTTQVVKLLPVDCDAHQ